MGVDEVMVEKNKVDWEAIECESARILEACMSPHGVESDITTMFSEMEMCGHHEDRIPMTASDSVVYEMAFKYGRADVVVFHVDGTASVIEIKNGSHGYNHVVSGIGQAGLYAAQLGMSKGAPTKVRKCLLWTSTGNLVLDALIEEVCEQANVVPLPYGRMDILMASRKAVECVIRSQEKEFV